MTQPGSRPSPWRTALSLGLLLVTLAACGGAGAPPAPKAEAEAEAEATLDAAGQDAAGRVIELASKEQDTYFMGALKGKKVVLAFTTTPSADLRSRLEAAADGLQVEYREVNWNGEELRAIADRVSADFDYWESRKIHISSSGADFETNTVLISLVEYSRGAATELLQRYGRSLVTVDPTSRPRAQR